MDVNECQSAATVFGTDRAGHGVRRRLHLAPERLTLPYHAKDRLVPRRHFVAIRLRGAAVPVQPCMYIRLHVVDGVNDIQPKPEGGRVGRLDGAKCAVPPPVVQRHEIVRRWQRLKHVLWEESLEEQQRLRRGLPLRRYIRWFCRWHTGWAACLLQPRPCHLPDLCRWPARSWQRRPMPELMCLVGREGSRRLRLESHRLAASG